ncbi:MASE1 domain-containing protein [Streptomyces sp. MW-W600-10]|uniref:MASE1 domain-containing protein n=1 Tax=Streptomyces sp. MW-W600-10 TaxID=2829819 RepID=UPI001C44BCD4|nr:MASE1 domain-containing protein [Streptomyces sp. MW-W600-10]MBV7242452.1 MASE1 domain-containing protein [Streptomyces sp. MW-W600-10]
MIRSKEARRRAVYVAQVLGVAGAYYLSGRLGLMRQVVVDGAVVTPLWPPTGIALAALLCLGTRVWPGIALGTLVTVSEIGDAFTVSRLAIMFGNTIAPLASYALLRKVGFRSELVRLRDGVCLVFLGAFAGMLISATLGSFTLLLDDKVPPGRFWLVWASWWAGDAMGVLVVTPVLLVLRQVRRPRPGDRWLEAAVLAVVVVLSSLIATRSSLGMIYLVFPVIIWAALRFQLPGSAPCALVVSVLAILAGTDALGPFAGHSLMEIMANLSLLNGCVALTALLLGAIVAEHRNIRRETEHAVEELEALVEQLAPLSGPTSARYGDRPRRHGPLDGGPHPDHP